MFDPFDISSASFAGALYDQWTGFFFGFEPEDWGLVYKESAVGDFNANDAWDVADIDLLQLKMLRLDRRMSSNGTFDLNDDYYIDLDDHRVWVKDLSSHLVRRRRPRRRIQ